MTTAPFSREQLLAGDDALREATAPHIADEDNLGLIRADFDALVGRMHREGSLLVNVEVLIADYLWAHANGKTGRTGYSLPKDAVAGQVSMPHDEWLDQVVTVGQNRRTLIRHLTTADLERMVEVRADNHAKTGQALEVATKGAAKLSHAIEVSGDIPTALDDGSLNVTFLDDIEGDIEAESLA